MCVVITTGGFVESDFIMFHCWGSLYSQTSTSHKYVERADRKSCLRVQKYPGHRDQSAMAATEKNQDLIQIAKGLEHIPWCEDYEKMISGMLYG